MNNMQAPGLESLKAYISERNFAPGDRLPPERELTETLGMKRATLRRALDVLEQQGVIWRHVGKGTFLAERSEASQELSSLSAEIGRQLTPVKMMRARLCIEPAIAREAAVNASEEMIARIYAAVEGAEEAPDWETYEQFDDQLHLTLAEATDNPLLLALYRQLGDVHRAIAWTSVIRATERPPRSHTSFAEHRALADAIAAHDPIMAHDAMRRHIGSVSARLFGEI